MALSQDQRALLQLMLARGQSYADIASLLGGDEASVRDRARGALTELAGSDPDAEGPLTDYLLGQADPIDRADAVRLVQRSPEANEMARDLSAQLALLVPDARLPEIPAPRRAQGRRDPSPPASAAGPGAGAAPGTARPTAGWGSVPANRLRVLIALIAGAILAIGVIVIVISSGDEGGGTTTSTTAGNAQAELARLERSFSKPIKLRSVDDGPPAASGQVALGTLDEQFGMTIEATKLAPSRGSQYYVPWLYSSKGEALPLADGKKVKANGKLSLVGLIRSDLLPILTRFRSIDVSIESKKRPTTHGGVSVLRGPIPGGGGLSEDQGTPTTATSPGS